MRVLPNVLMSWKTDESESYARGSVEKLSERTKAERWRILSRYGCEWKFLFLFKCRSGQIIASQGM